MTESTPGGVNAIFERFRSILHEGMIERRVQYMIEKLYEIRKAKFVEFPGVISELDLIEETDKITHNVSIDDDLQVEEECNFFKLDPDFEQNDSQWDEIKKEILGEYYSSRMGAGQNPEGSSESSSDEEEAGIQINTATVSSHD